MEMENKQIAIGKIDCMCVSNELAKTKLLFKDKCAVYMNNILFRNTSIICN